MPLTNFLVLVLCCLVFLPGYLSQVPGWGTLNSIGKLRYNQSSFYMYERLYEKNGVYGGIDTKWPKGIIPYNFDETGVDPKGNRFDKKWQAIQSKGFEAFMNNTCARFVPRTNEKDYLTYIFGDACQSGVGRVGGQQFVSMQGWCLPDIHETLHALGFDHEENRRDRDYYLAFNWSNIKPNTPEDDARSNGWYQKSNRPTYGTILDPKSIMTSSEWNGRINPTIKTFIFKDGSNPDINSAYKYYSEGDRLKVNRMFNCNPEDSCWDEDPNNCPVWAAAGACSDPKWVPKMCTKTCSCYDRSRNCINDDLHCKTSDWATWCNQTCNQCPPNKDSRNDCTYIAATLGCTAVRPVGVEKYCRKSCGICKRPAVVKIKPMILTKCMKTCNYWCQQYDGCKVPYPVPMDNVASSTCTGGWDDKSLLDWCKKETDMFKDCQGTCYAVGYRKKCPAECVDEDPTNCPKLAATKGCFSLYDGASIILN